MQATPAPESIVSGVRAEKYLTFQVGAEHYGIKVLCTREIIRQSVITRVPQMPAHVRGVINLRGRIIPVIDLRVLFGQAAAETHERACIIVVQVTAGAGGSTAMGLMVDAVDDVLLLGANEIEPAPEIIADRDTRHITGMAKTKDSLKTLLDLDQLLHGRS